MAIAVVTLALKLETGLHSFAQLSAEEQAFLVDLLRPKPSGFTEEQREFFREWRLIVPPNELNRIDQLCQGRSLKFTAQQLKDNRWVVGADLLTDTRQGENFNQAWQWLAGLKICRVSSSLLPEPGTSLNLLVGI